MKKNKCLWCKEETDNAQFCSLHCSNKHRYREPKYTCLQCGKKTKNKKFCSRSCAAKCNNKKGQETTWTDESRCKASKRLKAFYCSAKGQESTKKAVKSRRALDKSREFYVWKGTKYKKNYCRECKKRIAPGYKRCGSCHGKNWVAKWKTQDYKRSDGSVVHMDSSWEVKVAEDLDANRIDWLRPQSFPWQDKEGKDRRYYPDFYLPKYDVYLDPKNDYLIKKDKDKIERVCKQNKVRVMILNKDELNWASILRRLPN